MKTEIKELLQAVQDGTVSVDEALLKIKMTPFEDIGLSLIHI